VRPDTNEAQQIVQDLNNFLRPDGWQLASSGLMSGRPIFQPTRVYQSASIAIRSAHEIAAKVNSAYISRQVIRMEDAIESELAIDIAKEFIETVCKTILDGTGAEYERNDDVLGLVRKTTKALRVSRDDVNPAAEAADTIRGILSNLAQIAHGTAELRNTYGTGHGRAGRTSGSLNARHARLVVGASATLASLLYDTYENLGPSRG